MDRRDTCKGKPCPFWKKYKDNCPNYIEGQWRSAEGHVYATKDCAPRRSMILVQQIYDHMLDVRKDYGHVRNSNIEVVKAIGRAMQHSTNPLMVLEAEETKPQIKDNDG
jgi:hypothetical protein